MVPRIVLLCALVLTVWAYQPALRAGTFIYEDDYLMASPPVWTLPGRGLTQWTAQTVGFDARDQHAVNLGLHIATGLLVWAVAAPVVTPLAASFGAGVFLLHPLTSEAVSAISARGDLLVAIFSLIAVWATLGWTQWHGVWRLLLAGGAIVAAAMSKEIGLVAVPLVVLTLLAHRRRLPSTQLLMSALWCGLGLVVGATWWRMVSWLETAPGSGGPVVDWPTFATLQLTAVWHLLALLVWPVGFSIDHDIVGLAPAWGVAAGLLTAVALMVGIWAWHRRPVVAWALGWVALCVAPRFVFGTSEFIREKDLYLALSGGSVLIGAGLAWLWAVSDGAVVGVRT